jgi:biopolymer transport protein ExbB/TolQ
VGTFVKATRSGLIAASIASFALLVFSVAAFIKAKGKDRTMPSSK